MLPVTDVNKYVPNTLSCLSEFVEVNDLYMLTFTKNTHKCPRI